MVYDITIIARGNIGHRIISSITKFTNLKYLKIQLPSHLPKLIDEFSNYLPKEINSEVIISFALQPDLDEHIIEISEKTVIALPYRREFQCYYPKFKELCRKKGSKLNIAKAMCSISFGNTKFAHYFGYPKLHVRSWGGTVLECQVLRGAPCGSTWYAAKRIIGLPLKKASCKIGLFVQYYPCRASRWYDVKSGEKGGLHLAGEIHKKAFLFAITPNNAT